MEIKTLSIHLGCCGAPSYQYIGKITSNKSMLQFTQVGGQSHTQKRKLYTWGLTPIPQIQHFKAHTYTQTIDRSFSFTTVLPTLAKHISVTPFAVLSALTEGIYLVFREQRRQGPNGPKGGHFESRQLPLRPPTQSRRTK